MGSGTTEGSVTPVIKAIPTLYNGTWFRSRLEARWAAFFDFAEWRWTYEPVDTSNYAPDFMLAFKRPLFVEVKPLTWSDLDDDNAIIQSVRTKVAESGIRGEILLLGLSPITTGGRFNYLGQLLDVDEEGVSPWTDAFAFKCECCGRRTLASEQHSWHCRVTGCYDGRDHFDDWDAEFDFRRAGSEVQWRPSK